MGAGAEAIDAAPRLFFEPSMESFPVAAIRPHTNHETDDHHDPIRQLQQP
jgi:hypothetical protein